MVCSYIFVSEIMKMCKEKKVYENTEKVAFYHNSSCCFSYAGWMTGVYGYDYYPISHQIQRVVNFCKF